MKFTLPNHPETPVGLLRRSFALYQHSWNKVFFLALLLSMTAFLPHLFSLAAGEDIFFNLPIYSLQSLWLIILDLLILIFFTAILWRLHCLMVHKHDSLVDDLKIGILKIPSIFIASLIQMLFIVGVVFLISSFTFFIVLEQQINVWSFDWRNSIAIFLTFVQLAFILFILLSFYFYIPLIVLENKGILNSLSKSFGLVWKHWWTTIYVQSIPWISYLLLLIFIKWVVNQNVINAVLNILLFAIFIPWIATTLMVQLKDLELRKTPRFKNAEDHDYPEQRP